MKYPREQHKGDISLAHQGVNCKLSCIDFNDSKIPNLQNVGSNKLGQI